MATDWNLIKKGVNGFDWIVIKQQTPSFGFKKFNGLRLCFCCYIYIICSRQLLAWVWQLLRVQSIYLSGILVVKFWYIYIHMIGVSLCFHGVLCLKYYNKQIIEMTLNTDGSYTCYFMIWSTLLWISNSWYWIAYWSLMCTEEYWRK